VPSLSPKSALSEIQSLAGLSSGVPLAPLTTLELGGAARFFVAPTAESGLIEALSAAKTHSVPWALLAGGSNTIVPDYGFDGLVIAVKTKGWKVLSRTRDALLVDVQAGAHWDAFVDWSVEEGFSDLCCLSGIPGSVGATPIQNVGAYGQEVADALVQVRAYDCATSQTVTLPRKACAFSYRDSFFKRTPARFAVLSVQFRLSNRGAPALRYGELANHLADVQKQTPRTVRDAVLALRRRKSMVIERDDPNRRSVGSFFTNPIVPTRAAKAVRALAVSEGLAATTEQVPSYPAAPGFEKLAAGWLIEKSGFEKGTRRGSVGISTRHALALVHHGGGSTAELLSLADEIMARVKQRFGVALVREPRVIGTAG